MTLNEFVDTYNGELVRNGQCGELVRQYWIDVDHTAPPSYENSKDYWFNPVPGYNKITANPKPGDIAIYNGHGAYPEGHSAIYVGNGQVFEQNADPDGARAHVYTRTSPYLLGYLSKQGSEPEEEPVLNEGDVINLYKAMLGRDPSDKEVSIYKGKDWKTVVYAFISSDEFKRRVSGNSPTNAGDVINWVTDHNK